MADNTNPSGKRPPIALFIAVAAALLLVIGIIQYISQNKEAALTIESTAEQPAESTEALTEKTTAATATIDVNAALSDRTLGDTSAPVKISEHASFTCGHCGDFHRETFAKLKKEYIDTGKAYLVFSDFPLNAPAVQASMVARCLPQEKYFDFVSLLFEKQQDWAYNPNYLDYLKVEAGKAGLDEAHFQACIQNTELQEGIVNRMKGVQAQWNINSTPSFVINNRNTVSGAIPFEEFKKLIEAELAGEKSAAPAPAAAEPVETEEPVAEDEATPEPDEAPAAAEETPAPAATTPAAPAAAATTGSEESGTPAE
ncbi:MAG: DsbA family protein [Alphaproteobacteria bacterium]|jgi:protein-disulfide isomerase|nr:DsbA family protein [Alphaproteobacteria bacterium]